MIPKYKVKKNEIGIQPSFIALKLNTDIGKLPASPLCLFICEKQGTLSGHKIQLHG